MATTIVKKPNPINSAVTMEYLLEQMQDMLERSQGDADKASDPVDANYYQGCADAAKHIVGLITLPDIRFVCEYQLAGDMKDDKAVVEWMQHLFDDAIERDAILAGMVTGVWPGHFGLRLVTFTFDVAYDNSLFRMDMKPAELREAAEDLANGGIIPDSDVSVRWVTVAK